MGRDGWNPEDEKPAPWRARTGQVAKSCALVGQQGDRWAWSVLNEGTLRQDEIDRRDLVPESFWEGWSLS